MIWTPFQTNKVILARFVTPCRTYAYLMEEHGIKQGELSEVGSQGVVSEILTGKRRLNTRQVSALAKRFEVPGDLFI